MQTGIDRLFNVGAVREPPLFANKRIGLLAHQASVNSDKTHTLDILLKNKISVTKLFSPEHGLWGKAEDMESVDSGVDPKTKLPIRSLYGKTFESLKPAKKDLADIDILICDLQDIGSRYYTYAATMALCMKACAKANKEVVVLDRPNPINGIDIEGKILKKGFESFVGLYPIPVRHGMTIGELALYFNKEEKIGCKLHVVRMEGWKRKWYFDETDLPWINPSPNMRSVDAALLYPGMCLIEATNLSEGRGTNHPFELIGAPFIKGDELTSTLNKLKLDGVSFKPENFRPTFQKWAGQDCRGIEIKITDRRKFKSVLTGIAVLKTIYDLYPEDFKWRDKPYEFVPNIPAIDLLSGDDQLRKKLKNKESLEKIQRNWHVGYKEFLEKREKYLFY